MNIHHGFTLVCSDVFIFEWVLSSMIREDMWPYVLRTGYKSLIGASFS